MYDLRWALGVISSCCSSVAVAGDSSTFSRKSWAQKRILSNSEHTGFSSKPPTPVRQRTVQWNPLSQPLNGYIAWVFEKVFKGLLSDQVNNFCPEAELGRLICVVSQLFFKKNRKRISPKFLLILTPLICYLRPGSRREHSPALPLPHRTACSWGITEVAQFALYTHIRQA